MPSLFTALIQRFQVVICRTDTITTDKANVNSDPETWDFSGFATIDIEITFDAGGLQTITLDSSLLTDDSAATAAELVEQINATITDGLAFDDSNGQIVIASDTQGDSGSVEVGGAAGSYLGFLAEGVSGGAYDDVLGAPLPQDDGTQTGSARRRELAGVTLKCQLDREDWGKRTLTAGGESDKADIVIVLKKDHLTVAGLMGTNGLPTLHVGDRIDKILQLDNVVAMDFPHPPGMWINEVEPAGYGLAFFGVPEINLFYLHCSKDRTIEKQ